MDVLLSDYQAEWCSSKACRDTGAFATTAIPNSRLAPVTSWVDDFQSRYERIGDD
jgi:hypothetical protein